MHLKKIHVKNFRLLHDAGLLLEKKTTVIVGRNNSGKTSLTEVISRLLDERNAQFSLEDFSCVSRNCFWDAYLSKVAGADVADIRAQLPTIEVALTFEYAEDEDYGTLTDFVLDLDMGCTETKAIVRHELDEGKIESLFADVEGTDESIKPEFFRKLRERIPNLYTTNIFAVDPNDDSNRRALSKAILRAACANHCINAQRGLDDDSQHGRVVIGKVLENLFATAKTNESDAESYTLAEDLEAAVKQIQETVGADFNAKLDELLPALSLFGYPGLSDPKLLTETTFDVERLLTNHTKVQYAGSNGVNLPESYNGLGARNIILILLQLREYFKAYCALDAKPAVHLIFIEEPEVHLHPQMQEVFIRKLGEIATKFSTEIPSPWPVQFVVTTHSSHIANEAHFETIRYFMSVAHEDTLELKTRVKDLRQGLSGKAEPDRTFLHQYMTLTRCDLFFADKAILIEGTTERLLLPRIIRMIDKTLPEGERLGSQYVSIVEVGGAYTHLFFDLLQFLELKTLVITDIDSVSKNAKNKWVACAVHLGTRTSNACINKWFADPADAKARPTPAQLLAATSEQRTAGTKRLAFQLPENTGGACGRSFEDAFMLANPALFPTTMTTPADLELFAYEEASEVKKSEFALTQALTVPDWNIPRYIREGLLWLAPTTVPIAGLDISATASAPVPAGSLTVSGAPGEEVPNA
jgi:putative ATP-dependent endonuclease of OLD family